MKYDLCLINPPRPDLVNPHAQAPLGILYLAAVAEQAGHCVAVMNLAGAGMEPESWRLPEAIVYGITGTFLDVETVNVLATEIKRRSKPGVRVIVGGPIVLSAAELNSEVIDTIVYGEAEDRIGRLCEGARESRPVEAIKNLDALPFPARHLWSGPIGGNVFLGGTNYFGGGSATLLTSRGCPMACAFCAGPALASRKVRFRSAESVVAEMELCVQDFGIRQFRFSDEFFTCNPAHVEGICGEILRSDVLWNGDGCAWRVSIGVKPHDVNTFKLMRAAGCREVALGVESADPRVLEVLNKRQSPEDALAALTAARIAGLKTRALMMCGTPGERPETLRHNLTFLRTAPFDALAMMIFTPIPGSAIATDPGRYGCRIVSPNRSLCLYGPDGRADISPTISVEGMSEEALCGQVAATIRAAERTGKLGGG